LWEGSCTPAAARTAAGLFLAEDAPDLAFEGAVRRMTLPPPFPNTIIVLSEMGSEQPSVKVFGYPDSSSAKSLAAALEVEVESVPRPLVTQVSWRPQGNAKHRVAGAAWDRQVKLGVGVNPFIGGDRGYDCRRVPFRPPGDGIWR
jgi:hypothetical protein